MKEQEFIKQIKQKTTDLPIPDSISPSNMKKMLEDYNQNRESFSDNNEIASTNKSRHSGYFKISITAACLALCVIGGIYGTRNTTNKTLLPEKSPVEKNDSYTEEDSLVSNSSLTTPDSYEDYYDTLKKAYDDYYDSISMVEESAVSDEIILDSAMNESASVATAKQAVNELSDSSNATGYSRTNTQEENVDEGDIIKTDGEYIYRVTEQYDRTTYNTTYRLSITQVTEGDMEIVYQAPLNDSLSISQNEDISFHEFYLQDNRLFVLYTRQNITTTPISTKSYIAVFNIKDKSQPDLITTLSQSGYYVSSRISDGYLYTISNFCDTSLEDKAAYETYLPSVNDTIIECSDLYYGENVLTDSTYVITSVSLKNPSDFTDTKAFPTSGGDTYVSDNAIYLYCTQYNDITQTEISLISYKKGTLTVGSSATVSGYLYDSFALSEKDGYLRIVATIPANNIMLLRNSDFTEDTQNNVREDVNALYILDNHMKLASKLTGIAPGEQIYSARFIGDMGYFVTYENTDPLFSVDLSDPQNPQIVGKLKIPGFSNYLHPYSDNLLLGIGEETDPNTQEFKGLKLSMFDISNPADVTETEKYVIKNSQFSPALYNHKAIMIDTDNNLFGFVYTTYDDTTAQYYYYFATFTYDAQNGFTETAHYRLNDKNEYDYDSVRGVYIGNYLYISSNEEITSYPLGDSSPIKTVYIK